MVRKEGRCGFGEKEYALVMAGVCNYIIIRFLAAFFFACCGGCICFC